jgi:D-alanyl-D-alanine carboxypeptidase
MTDAARRAVIGIVVLAVVAAGTALGTVLHSDRTLAAARRGEGAFAAAGSHGPAGFRGQVLVWAFGGFSSDEVKRVRDSRMVATIVAVRTGRLAVASGMAGYPFVPVEAIAVAADAYAAAVGKTAAQLGGQLQKGVVLSETAARLRKLRVGSELRLSGGRRVEVTGVVADWMLGGYEAAISRERGRGYNLQRATYLLIRPRGARAAFEADLRHLLPGRALRLRTPGERPFLRAADDVPPLALVKRRFGEFRTRSLLRPQPDPRWMKANLATAAVPILGRVRCHRLVMPALSAAMAELHRERLDGLIDVADFRRNGGCFSVRARPGDSVPSRHLWGIAVDLNPSSNPGGLPSSMDRRIVRVMQRYGFAWGGQFLRPDGSHFEWVGARA